MAAYFFSENWLKANSPVTKNMDYEDLRPFIEVAQETIVLPRIGRALYNRLLESIELVDYNADELELIKIIRPVAAYQTIYLAFPFLQTKLRNAGIVKNGDAMIQTISGKEMEVLRSEINQMSGFYLNKLVDYLCVYSSKFPQYNSSEPLQDKVGGATFDYGGFLPFKSGLSHRDDDLIRKMINYKKL